MNPFYDRQIYSWSIGQKICQKPNVGAKFSHFPSFFGNISEFKCVKYDTISKVIHVTFKGPMYEIPLFGASWNAIKILSSLQPLAILQLHYQFQFCILSIAAQHNSSWQFVTIAVNHASKKKQVICILAQWVRKVVGCFWGALSYFRLQLAADQGDANSLFPETAFMASFLHCKFHKTCPKAGPTVFPNCPPHVLQAKLIQQLINKAFNESTSCWKEIWKTW